MADGGEGGAPGAGREDVDLGRLIGQVEEARTQLQARAKREDFTAWGLIGSVIGAVALFAGFNAFDSYQLSRALENAGGRIDVAARELAADREAARRDLLALREDVEEEIDRVAALEADMRTELDRALGLARPDRASVFSIHGDEMVLEPFFENTPRNFIVFGPVRVGLRGYYHVRAEGAPGRLQGSYFRLDGPLGEALIEGSPGEAYGESFYREGFFDDWGIRQTGSQDRSALIPQDGRRRFQALFYLYGEDCEALAKSLAPLAEASGGEAGRLAIRPILESVAETPPEATFDIVVRGTAPVPCELYEPNAAPRPSAGAAKRLISD